MEDINQLQNEANAIDAEFIPAGDATSSPDEPAISFTSEARGLIDFAVSLFTPLFPSLAAIYTEPAKASLAGATAPLMEKYNFSMGKLFERWGAEINFAIVAMPLGLQTYQAVKLDIASRKEKAEQTAKKTGAAMGHPSMAEQPQEVPDSE